MTPERWEEVERVFGMALDAEEGERAAIVRRECGDDDELCREVLELIEVDARSGDLLSVVGEAVSELAEAETIAAHDRAREALEDLGVDVGDTLEERYRIERVLGAGGMGVVVEATHVALDERVAMKLLRPGALESRRARERFVREAKAAAKVNSEHIVRVRDVGVAAQGAPFMVMDMLDGCDLQTLLAERQRLPVDEAVGMVLQVCEALAAAHAAGIVHRDIKPANLFLERRPHGGVSVKLLDFGISKHRSSEDESLTGSSDMIGSPAYMSPEQLRRPKDVDERADIWSLGVVLYELLGGQRPFQGESLADLSMSILVDPPLPHPDDLALPAPLIAALDHCLEKQRDARMPDVATLAMSLSPFAPDGRARAYRVSHTLGTKPVLLPVPAEAPEEAPAEAPAPRSPRIALVLAAVAIPAAAVLAWSATTPTATRAAVPITTSAATAPAIAVTASATAIAAPSATASTALSSSPQIVRPPPPPPTADAYGSRH